VLPIILDNKFRNLKTENQKLNDTIKNRDRTITNLNNQTATLEKERTELKRTLDLRNSTIAY
jgi:predicted  nucleic acid-binding Zn-ribbon protein